MVLFVKEYNNTYECVSNSKKLGHLVHMCKEENFDVRQSCQAMVLNQNAKPECDIIV